eukprot:12861929-Heterocapsa_arctica.AAC.1
MDRVNRSKDLRHIDVRYAMHRMHEFSPKDSATRRCSRPVSSAPVKRSATSRMLSSLSNRAPLARCGSVRTCLLYTSDAADE